MTAKKKNIFVLGSLGLIVLGIALASIINNTMSTSGSASDIRAQAAISNKLKINATVQKIDETSGTIVVSDIYFSDDSRSGDIKNLGSWFVKPPRNFKYSTVFPGTKILIEVNSKLFRITQHTITALAITVEK